jgi:uncharacterized protein (DUF3820 family)
MQTTISLPFGCHKGRALPEIPAAYLCWLLRATKLSSGLRSAVCAELKRRGVAVPDPPPPLPACERCGPGAGHRCTWAGDRLGRRHVRAECGRCGGFLTFPPSVPPYSTMADAAATPTPVQRRR